MADITRAEPDAPNRCQTVNSKGQCQNEAVEGGTNCLAHGGNKQLESIAKAGLRNYRKSVWLARIGQHADNPGIKSLREEIGILRIILEERLTHCDTPLKLMMESQSIADLVMKVDHVVTSCHKLEDKLKLVVDKSQLIHFASVVVDAIASIVTDERMMEAISTAIVSAIDEVGKDEHAV